MDEISKEPVALSYWTREKAKSIEWIQLLAKLHIKFVMTAYCEGRFNEQIYYVFRLEPIPEDDVKNYLKKHGFEHAFFVYKKEKFNAREMQIPD